MVAIEEGKSVTIELTGQRVAYSCYGRIRTLNGQGITGVTVEAKAENCDQVHEEGASESDGTYRILGLQVRYTIGICLCTPLVYVNIYQICIFIHIFICRICVSTGICICTLYLFF